MSDPLRLLSSQPVLLLAILLGIGSLLGSVKLKGVHLGPAAVLFAAIAIGSLGAAHGVALALPEVVGTLGLVLFTYTVGLVSGPSFFASLRRGWVAMAAVFGVLACGAVVAVLVGRALGLSSGAVAGTFAGALTNTPALAAASQRAGDAAGPAIGYSIAYLYGVLAFIGLAILALRRRGGQAETQPITNLTVRVDLVDPVCADDVARDYGHQVVFSRVQHGEQNPVEVVEGHELLRRDDLVTVVGPAGLVRRVADRLGHPSSHTLQEHRRELDIRRITVSQPGLAGRTVAELGLEDRFGARATRVRRGDRDLIAQDDMIVQMGDRIRVLAPVEQLTDVSRYLGDSERGLSDINPIGFALGLALGVVVGLVPIPIGGGFTIGSAAGTLLVGLLFGRLVRLGPLVVSMSNSSATSLSTFGMITFLAYAGSRAGEHFMAAVTSDLGWKVFVLGAAVTTTVGVLVVVGGRLRGVQPGHLAGLLAGTQTQPAVLAFANERSNHDLRVGVGYALAYPAAMIAKIIIAQVLAGR